MTLCEDSRKWHCASPEPPSWIPLNVSIQPFPFDGARTQHVQEATSGVAAHASPRSAAVPGPVRHRAPDTSYHPYKPPAPAPPPTTITFVDSNEQTAAASKGKASDGLQACKPKRKRILPVQLVKLLAVFETTDSPSYDVREKLGAETGMSNREVQVWFQNRRAKVNRDRLAALAADEATRAAAVIQDASLPFEHKVPVEMMSSGQHQWRFRSPMQATQPASQPGYAPPSPTPITFPTPTPHSHSNRMPYPYSPPAYPSYAAAPSPYYPPPPHTALLTPPSPQGIPSSSYFGLTSPPLSTSTSSLASPGTACSPSYSTYTPNSLASPASTFFRLTLDSLHSPHTTSRKSVVEVLEPDSPREDAPEPRIELPPIRWLSRPMHRRSISDSAAHAAMLPPPAKVVAAIARPTLVRLPSLRGLLNDDEHVVVPVATASAPTSPVEPNRSRVRYSPHRGEFPNARPAASALPKRPGFISRYSTLDIHTQPSHARAGPFAVQRECARMCVDGEEVASGGGETGRGRASRQDPADGNEGRRASGRLSPAQAPSSMGVGLGMLVAAATELRANEDEKLARLAAAKEMR
ncbi:hypothetical protein JCM3770_000702 [Rhodotorula araucariae]